MFSVDDFVRSSLALGDNTVNSDGKFLFKVEMHIYTQIYAC